MKERMGVKANTIVNKVMTGKIDNILWYPMVQILLMMYDRNQNLFDHSN